MPIWQPVKTSAVIIILHNKLKTNQYNSNPRSRATIEVFFITLIALRLTYFWALMTHSSLENPYPSSDILSTLANQAGHIAA